MTGRSEVIDPAPPTIDRGGGGGGGWAWLVTTSGRIEAELVRGLLEATGVVPVWLDTRDPSPSAWLFPFGDPNAPVKVFVPTSMLETARLAMLEAGFATRAGPGEPERENIARRAPWALIAIASVLLAIFLWATMHASVV
jgi:hypothetical protein